MTRPTCSVRPTSCSTCWDLLGHARHESLAEMLGASGDAVLREVGRLLQETARDTDAVARLKRPLRWVRRHVPGAERLRVHRHTLRYRMEQLRKQTGGE